MLAFKLSASLRPDARAIACLRAARLRAAADRRWEAGGAPRALYKWVAYMEASKRARWQRAAEMAQWEAKYSRPADAN